MYFNGHLLNISTSKGINILRHNHAALKYFCLYHFYKLLPLTIEVKKILRVMIAIKKPVFICKLPIIYSRKNISGISVKTFFIVSFLLVAMQVGAQQQNFKFDFGTTQAAKGYVAVGSNTVYDKAIGYGFTGNAEVKSVKRSNKKNISSSFITGNKPFYFSVKLPEGNYDVKLTLGDIKGISATTVRTECRRLFLLNASTKKDEIKTLSFTVHIRDSLIRDSSRQIVSKIKLKSREINYLHWDDLLTIEFNDSMPKICALEITPNTTATTIFLAGNSTVVDQDREPWAAWGQMIPAFFKPGKIAIANYAESGETLKAFKNERRLEKIWSMAKPGDYIFIEFTHNDQKPGSNYLEAGTTYKQTLKMWIEEARKRSMIPVLVTSMHRRNFDSLGHIVNTLAGYPQAAREVAAEENIAMIDLNAMSKILYEAWGPEQSVKGFVHYPAHSFPGQNVELKDNTHFSTYGAYQLAKAVVLGIQKAKLPFATELNTWGINFDPAHPDGFSNWYWPLSPLMQAIKPDGN
ncbi:rhamnogalacturonan acetylesterase [soil metagenome]